MSRTPDFIVIGTYKCGTTWLQRVLEAHPDVFVPDFKEFHYFSDMHGDGQFARHGMAWYRAAFSDALPSQQIGEVSPGYLRDTISANRIADAVPNASLVCMFRNPIERAWSHYHYQNDGKRPMPFSFDALCRDPTLDSDDRWSILRHGLYAENLTPWFDLFARERFHFLLDVDLKEDRDRALSELFHFVDVDPAFDWRSNVEKRVNSARALRSPLLYWTQYHAAMALQRFGLAGVRKLLKRAGLPALLTRLNTVERPNPSMTSAQHSALRAYYEPSIRALEQIVGRPLDRWRDPAGLVQG